VRKSLIFLLSCVVASLALVAPAWVPTTAQASPADDYVGPFFGNGNLPPGCIKDRSRANPANICHHGTVGLNGLDSPVVDVAVLVPASPTAERDLRIMRQAVEAWEGGIHYLAGEMGLDWLHDGVDFHITPSIVGAATGDEVSTFPLYDPEIVVIASNPVGAAGVGVDPTYATAELGILDEDGVPCHTIQNPFSLDAWEGLPGYDGHHDAGGGVYVEDCGGAGGNVCFSVNGGIDPVAGTTDVFSLFDLVLHETGHCLSLGHVGDGLDGVWGPVPTADIMAYSYDPPGQNKCVSTLNVEGFALRMSRYLDVNGDGIVTEADRLVPNDLRGDGSNPMQVQRPQDHHYASSTGSYWECPQPDLGMAPGVPTDWTPDPVETTTPVLDVTGPEEGAIVADGQVSVTGNVQRKPNVAPPTSTTASAADPDGDSNTPLTDLQKLDVEVTDLEVTATLKVAQLWPSTEVTSLPKYGIVIDGQEFESYIPDPRSPATVKTWDHSYEHEVPAEWSSWDTATNAVTFHIPRSYLADNSQETAPYDVFAMAGYGGNDKFNIVPDDRAPDAGFVGVAEPGVAPGGTTSTTVTPEPAQSGDSSTSSVLETVVLEQEGGNHFGAEDTQTGLTDNSHHFTLDVPETSHVELTLAWEDNSDLDLSVSGAATASAVTAGNPERVVLNDVQGKLDITVNPSFIFNLAGTTYTLIATLDPGPGSGDSDGDGLVDSNDPCPSQAGPAPTGCADSDGDGVRDPFDLCPDQPGNGADGCPIETDEQVHVYVDGMLAASTDVTTGDELDTFAIDVTIPPGAHEVRTDWEDAGEVIATTTRTLTVRAPNTAPTVRATVTPVSVWLGASQSFDATGDDAETPDALTYRWSFGDGTTAIGEHASHRYGAAGVYTARVTVTDAGGLTASTTRTVHVGKRVGCAHPNIVKTGSWRARSSVAATGGTYCDNLGSGSGNDTITVKATGDQVGLSFARGKQGGAARIYIDGVDKGLISFHSSASKPAFGYSKLFTGLTNTTHTMKIVVTSGQAYVDDVHVWGPLS